MRRFVVSLLAVMLMLPEAQAAPSVKNYCAKKSTGVVRAITAGNCSGAEYSLGAKAIAMPATRPKGVLPQLMARYWAAKAAAKKAGVYLRITSGYRRLEDQAYLFRQAVKKYGSPAKASKWVLPPEYSTHPWGVALDVNFRTKLKKGALWLEKNGYKWGLCRAYENEWWHFEGLTTPGTPCPKRWKDAVARFPSSVQ